MITISVYTRGQVLGHGFSEPPSDHERAITWSRQQAARHNCPKSEVLTVWPPLDARRDLLVSQGPGGLRKFSKPEMGKNVKKCIFS